MKHLVVALGYACCADLLVNDHFAVSMRRMCFVYGFETTSVSFGKITLVLGLGTSAFVVVVTKFLSLEARLTTPLVRI